jgi:hypothetical protein
MVALGDGTLAVTDPGYHRILRVRPAGADPEGKAAPAQVTTLAGTGEGGWNDGTDAAGQPRPAAEVQLNRPMGLALDRKGGLVFADQDNHRIRRLTPGGQVVTLAGTGEPGCGDSDLPALESRLSSPGDLLVLDDGRIVFVDEGNNRVLALDGEGKLEVRFGYLGDAPEPERTWLLLALGPGGRLHGSDGLRIFRIDGYEDAVTVVPTAFRLRNPPEPVEAAAQARVRGVTALVRGPGGGLVVVDRLGWVRYLEPGRGGSVLGEQVRKAAFEARGGNRRELDHAAGCLARCAGKPDPDDPRVPWLDDMAKAGFRLGGNRLPPELGAQVLECLMDVPGRAARAAIALEALARMAGGAGETAGTDAKEPGGAPAP